MNTESISKDIIELNDNKLGILMLCVSIGLCIVLGTLLYVSDTHAEQLCGEWCGAMSLEPAFGLGSCSCYQTSNNYEPLVINDTFIPLINKKINELK